MVVTMKSVMIKAAKEASKIILKHYGSYGKLKFKNPRSLLTKVDLLSDEKIKRIISKKCPKHNFLTEESGFLDKGSEYTWIIDPIDGTTNFVHGFPYFCTSIGLEVNGEIVVGVVDAPFLGVSFWATRGGGAFQNGKRLKVLNRTSLDQCLLATGFSYERYQEREKQIEILVKKSVRDAVASEFMKLRALVLPYISPREQLDIETRYGKKPSRKPARSFSLEI